MKKTFKVIARILGVLLLLVVLLVLLLWVNSPGKTSPVLDDDGVPTPKGIAEIVELKIGGLRQTIIIRGADSTKQILLYLHGGPGGTLLGLRTLNPNLEKDFVVVYWDQLGSGKSYDPEIPTNKMTLPEFINYTSELSEYLIKRFKQEKIYLLGESWGTLVGILTVQQRPELYHGYFGSGNLFHGYRNEQVSLEWVKKQAEERKDEEGLAALKDLQLPDSLAESKVWSDYLEIQRTYLIKYGGAEFKPLNRFELFLKILFQTKEYTLKEKLNLPESASFSFEHLSPIVGKTDLFRSIDSLHVPIYLLQGRYDYNTPTPIAKDFYRHLKAPHKEFHVLEQSAHIPHMEEPDKFNSILRSIVYFQSK